MSYDEVQELYEDEQKKYTDYVKEYRGDLIPKHEKPDPDVVEAKRAAWAEARDKLMSKVTPEELRQFIAENTTAKRVKRQIRRTS